MGPFFKVLPVAYTGDENLIRSVKLTGKKDRCMGVLNFVNLKGIPSKDASWSVNVKK